MMKIYLQFFLFISLSIYSLTGYSQAHIDNFKNSYQYALIDTKIKQTSNNVESQLQVLLHTVNSSTIQQYFIHHNLAYLYFKRHDKKNTLAQLNITISLIKSIPNNSYHLAKSLLLRAKIYGILFHNTQTAITDLQQAILTSKLSNHIKVNHLKFDIQTAMAQAYNQLGKLKKAQEFSEQSLITAKLLNDKNETIYALIIAGRIAFQQDNFDLAYQTFLKALQLSDRSTPKKQIASIELRLAIAYESQNIYEQALIHAKKAASLYSQISEERLQIKSLRVLGNIYLSLGDDIDNALVHFINGLSIAKAINSVSYIGQMQHLIGRAYLLENNIDKAQRYITSAQVALKESKSWFYLALNTIELAKLAKQQGYNSQATNLIKVLLIDKNVQNYPALINEAKEYLLRLYITQEDYKNAFLLQQQLLISNERITEENSQKMIKKFDHDVEIKSLNERLTKENIDNEKNKLLIKNKSNLNNVLILAILLFILVIFILYFQKNNWKKRLLLRSKNSVLTWDSFKKSISTQSAQNKGLHILICSANSIISTQQNSSQERQSSRVNQSLSAINQLHISTITSINHNALWLLCNSPLSQIKHSLSQLNVHSEQLPLHYLLINLDAFPQNMSEQCIIFIEKLINHVTETLTTLEDDDITNVIIQSKALPLIFSANEKKSTLEKIKKAIQQGLITTELSSLTPNS